MDTGIAGDVAVHLEITITGNDSFQTVVTPLDPGSPYSQYVQPNGNLFGTAGTAIDNLQIQSFKTGSSSTGEYEVFFNNLQIIPEPASLALLVIGGLAGCMLRRRR